MWKKISLLISLGLCLMLAPFAPRIAGTAAAAGGINFVSVLETPFTGTGEFCFSDRHLLEANQQADAKDEVVAGMDFAAVNDGVFFRGIIRADKADERGLVECEVICPDGTVPPCESV